MKIGLTVPLTENLTQDIVYSYCLLEEQETKCNCPIQCTSWI